MDYTYNSNNQQSPSETTDEYLRIPSTLTNFINTDTTRELQNQISLLIVLRDI